MSYQRFIDRKDKKRIIASCPDFQFRQHGLPPAWILYSFVVAMLVVVIMINYMSIKLILLPDNIPTPTSEVLAFLFTISALILGISLASYIIIRRISDIVLQTEFQNLLFASSMSANTEFVVITSSDGIMVYYDQHFDQFFADSRDKENELDRLLEHPGLSSENNKKLKLAIETSQDVVVPFKAKNATGVEQSYELVADPLKRPKNFSAIRCFSK